MVQIVTQPDRGTPVVTEGGIAAVRLDAFFDELVQRLNTLVLGDALVLKSYEVASLPAASDWTGSIIYVSNENGGAVTAFSDGTDWRRTTDRAVVS